jgi:hypothetical protein
MRLLNIIRIRKEKHIQGVFQYLAPRLNMHNKEGEEYTNIELQVQNQVWKAEPKSINMRLTYDEERRLSVMMGTSGIKHMMESKLNDEMDTTIEQTIYKTIKELGLKNPSIKPIRFAWLKRLITKWFSYRFITRIKSIDELQKYVISKAAIGHKLNYKGSYNFVVVNPRIAAVMQDSPAFEIAPFEQTTPLPISIQKVGTLFGRVTVYVNPFLPWKDTTLVFGFSGTETDGGLHYILVDRSLVEQQIQESMTKTYALVEQSALVATPESNTIYYTEEILLHKSLI